jgi:hypothetical protein
MRSSQTVPPLTRFRTLLSKEQLVLNRAKDWCLTHYKQVCFVDSVDMPFWLRV